MQKAHLRLNRDPSPRILEAVRHRRRPRLYNPRATRLRAGREKTMLGALPVETTQDQP